MSQFEVAVGDMLHALDYTQKAWAQIGYAVGDGCEPHLDGDLTVAVESGTAYHDGEAVEVEPNSVTIPSGQSQPRKDTLYLDADGVLRAETGDPANAQPTGLNRELTYSPAPPVPDERSVIIAEIWVPADATSVGEADLRPRLDESRASYYRGEFDVLDVTPLAEGTLTATGGDAPAAYYTVDAVTEDETRHVEVLLAPAESPPFAGDYSFNYRHSREWNDAEGHLDVTIQATWDTDPGEGNDLDLAYQILPRY